MFVSHLTKDAPRNRDRNVENSSTKM